MTLTAINYDGGGPAWRVAHGGRDPADIEFVAGALFAHFYDEANLPLERRLRAPTNIHKARKQRRNDHVVRAAGLMQPGGDASGPWERAGQLAGLWKQFVVRGSWKSWADDGQPPSYASAFEFELFYATELTREETRYLEQQQVYRLARHVFLMR